MNATDSAAKKKPPAKPLRFLERSPQSLPADVEGTVSAGALIGTVSGAVTLGVGLAGPAGAVVGAVSGAIAGALAGKGLAETTIPDEDQYWRRQHPAQPYAKGRPYEDFMDAYRVGYQGFSRHSSPGTFEQREPELRSSYDQRRVPGSPSWEEASFAAHAAWDHVARAHDAIVSYDVLDSSGYSMGRIHTLWRDEDRRPIFAAVTTAWVLGRSHLIPLAGAEIDTDNRTVRVPHSKDKIQSAPTVNPATPLSGEDQQRAYAHFDIAPSAAQFERSNEDIKS